MKHCKEELEDLLWQCFSNRPRFSRWQPDNPIRKERGGIETFNLPTNISYSGSLHLLPLLFKNQNGDFLLLIFSVSSACTSGVKWLALYNGHSLCDAVRLDNGPALKSLPTGMDLHRGLFESSNSFDTSLSDSPRFRLLGVDLVISSEFGDVAWSRVGGEVKE